MIIFHDSNQRDGLNYEREYHTKKETYISTKSISYWFDVNQVKERLEKISKNKKYKKTQQEMAAKILEDINYPRDEIL